MKEFALKTARQELHPITQMVQQAVVESGVQNGACVVYCPHTTAGITINENADPDVKQDLIFALETTCPDRQEFRHAEGNSAAHLKALITGSSVTIPVQNAKLALGRWQGIYFCEYDGPRTRKFQVVVLPGA